MLQLSLAGREWIARHHTAESHLRVLRAVFGQPAESAATATTKAALAGHIEAREA